MQNVPRVPFLGGDKDNKNQKVQLTLSLDFNLI